MIRTPDLVLVVDDDLEVGASLKFALEIEGFTVLVCGGGDALLMHPQLGSAACILLDYKMPGMDAFAVLHQLAARSVVIPVILMTAHVTDALRRRAAAAGIQHVLEKPLFNGGLLDALHDTVAPRRTPT